MRTISVLIHRVRAGLDITAEEEAALNIHLAKHRKRCKREEEIFFTVILTLGLILILYKAF